MPINPNIALGVQPVQQPNMLGQMGQIMAIRAAQQEMEGNENTRNYFAKPISERGDPSQLLGTKQGQAAYKALNEGQIKQLEAEQKRINLVGAGAGAVLENPTMETFTAVVSDLVNRGIYTPQQRDQAFAAIGNDPSKIKAFVTPIFNQAISAEKRLSDITSRRNTDVSSGPAYGQLKLAQEEAARKQKEFELIRGIVSSGTSSATASPVNLGGGPAVAPVAGGPASTNVLADQVAPTTAPDVNVNAFNLSQKDQLINQISQLARIPSVEASRALDMKIKEHNVLYPDAKVEQDRDGNLINIVNGRATPVVGLNGLPIKGKPLPSPTITLTEVDDPATPGQKLKVDAQLYKQGTTLGAPGVLGVARTENLTPAQKLKLQGEISKDYEALQRVVGQTNELLESIDAVRSSNLESVTGQFDARTPSFGTEAQVAETRFNNLKGKVTAIAKANASLGGAIGSIANQEWQILANQIAVLERTAGKTANLEQIEQLERQAMSIVARMRDGFQRQYGGEVERLAPQYKTVPDVNYTPGQYTKTGKVKSGVDNKNPLLQ
jgi:hypothetical protein